MDVIQIFLSNFDARVIKEPRGFMKVLQFIFTICAFATTTSFSSILKVNVHCDEKDEIVTVPIYYSFTLYDTHKYVCSGAQTLLFRQDFSSDCRFFVAVGVLAFLFSIGALVFYLIFDKIYNEDARIPTLDFVVHGIFSILFLAGSSAWANSLSGLKSAMTLETITAENPVTCANNSCSILVSPDFGKLNISVILGFLNLFLFASNLWFIYKETAFFPGKANQDKSANEVSPGIDPTV